MRSPRNTVFSQINCSISAFLQVVVALFNVAWACKNLECVKVFHNYVTMSWCQTLCYFPFPPLDDFKYSSYCGGLNVQSFRQMYWNLRDFMSILRWTDHELWLIADPPISLIDSFIDWFKLLLVNFLRFSCSVAVSLWRSSFYFFDTQVLTS